MSAASRLVMSRVAPTRSKNGGSEAGAAPGVYRQRHYVTLVVVIGAIALVAPALAQSRSDKFLVNLWLVYAIAGIGFYWIFGMAGRFAFCQTLMMAFGAYTSAYVVNELGPGSFLVGLVAGVAASAVLAALIGLATRNTKEFYFAIATLAATQIGMLFFRRATWFTGPNGTVAGVDPPKLFGHTFLADGEVFWLLLGGLAIVLLIGIFLERSPLRRSAIAVRDNEVVARAQGLPAQRIQLGLFIAGSAAGGFSGVLLGHWTGSIGTDAFGMQLSIGIFLILLIGGADSLWGPVVGAAFFVAVPELLSGLEKYETVVYGAILLVVVILFPQGIVGGLRQIRAKVSGRRRAVGAADPTVALETIVAQPDAGGGLDA